jgi:hypothetical protein
LIGGLAHSGKTLLRKAIGAHPDIAMTRRTYLWRFHGKFGDLKNSRNLDRCLTTMVADRWVRALSPDRDRIRKEFLDGPSTYARLFGLFHQHHAERLGKRRWGEQIRLIERLADPIFEAFPDARIIHMIRDPRRSRSTTSGQSPPGKMGWEMASWLSSARSARRNQALYPDRYAILQFEELAERPLETVRTMCDFIEVEYSAAMGQALSADHPADELDSDTRRTAEEVSFIEDHAGRELRGLGYAGRDETPYRRSLSWLAHRPADITAMIAWRIVRRREAASPIHPAQEGG